MTGTEKKVNLLVIETRAKLHTIMKDIETKDLYDKLVDLDKQLYTIREIVKGKK